MITSNETAALSYGKQYQTNTLYSSVIKSCHQFCCDVWSEACKEKPVDTSPLHFFKYGSVELVTAEPIHALWKEDHYDNLGWCCMSFEFFIAV